MPRVGTGRVYQRGNVWWVQYGVRGKNYRESSKSTKKKDAVALLKRRMAEQGAGKFIGPDAERVTFDDLAELITSDYKANGRRSLLRVQQSLAHLRVFFGAECRALDITTDRVNSYIVARQEAGAANATIQQEIAALRRSFNLAVQAGRLAVRPHVPSVHVDNARKGFFGGEDLERVIAELPSHVGSIVRFAALTGWRRGEVVPLRWSQVDWEAGVVRLEPGTTKNREGREFPFRALPPLAALLEAQREHTRTVERETGRIVPWIFHREGAEVRTFRGPWTSACERAGVPGLLFHDLRRTAVRNLERAGVPRSVAMKLTGHKTEAVYRRYAIADAAALSEGVEKLARLHAGPAVPATVVPLDRRRAVEG